MSREKAIQQSEDGGYQVAFDFPEFADDLGFDWEDEEEVDMVQMKQDSKDNLARFVRRRAARVFSEWQTLQAVVGGWEEVIRKRWAQKSKVKRKQILLEAWPDMPKSYRPDLTEGG
jgi:uncharacterized protein YbdZ (MbtH family)